MTNYDIIIISQTLTNSITKMFSMKPSCMGTILRQESVLMRLFPSGTTNLVIISNP
jgi:hypothetical protein